MIPRRRGSTGHAELIRFRSRIGRRMFALALFIVLSYPAFLRAQFQEPTAEELKMTADPKAPGASAVFLYREEIEDEPSHTYTLYVRIKVLTDKGKELATVSTPYAVGTSSFAGVQGRTIHSDGTVVLLTAQPTDLVGFQTKGFQVDSAVFTLPSVETNSILEYRLSIHFKDAILPPPTWEIEQPYFVHKAHYLFHSTRFLNLIASKRMGVDANVQSDGKGRYSLDLADIPPIPDEEFMPPVSIVQWRVEFHNQILGAEALYWNFEGRRWENEIDEFIKSDSQLKKAAAGIVAESDTERTTAEKLYGAVMQLDNTDFSRKKSQAERKKEKLKVIRKAEDVWKQRGGTGDELALLYVALARAAGLKAWPMQVADRSRTTFDKSHLSTDQLDDFIAVVTLGSKEVYLDPGQKMCPFARLAWQHEGATGFRLGNGGAIIATTPAAGYDSAVVQRTADLTIGPDGKLQGTVRLVMTGPDALHWRQMTLENDQDEVKKSFNEFMQESVPDGVQADFDHFLALDDYTVNLIGIVKVSGTLGTATGKHFFLPGLFFEARARHPFVAQDKRVTPIDVHYAKLVQDEVTYHLPPGYDVESWPQTPRKTWADRAYLAIGTSSSGDSVKVERTLAYNYALLEPKDYPGLHDFYQNVATADQQQLVLIRSQVAKGN